MSSPTPRTDISSKPIRLVKFSGRFDTISSETLRFEQKLASLTEYNSEYRQFLQNQEETISSSQTFQDWMSWNGSHGHTDQDAVEARCSLPNPFKPRYRWGDFLAISYIWGDRSDLRVVYLNDQEIRVSRNLEEALRAAVKIFYTRNDQQLYIWNDFMCIDQEKKEEIDLSLKQFSNIFATAYIVYIWTGTEADHSVKFFQLADATEKSWNALRRESIKQAARKVGLLKAIEMHTELFKPLLSTVADKEVWAAVAHFLDRPYWKRLWIIQELALANEISILSCGESSVLLTSIWHLVRLLNGYQDLLQLFLTECMHQGWMQKDMQIVQRVLARLRYIADLSWTSKRGLPSDLGRLTKVSRESQQERAQDKIYGLMGMLPPGLVARLQVDSAKAPSVVFADFTRAYIQATGSLDILRYCGISESYKDFSWAVNLLTRRISTSSLDNGQAFLAGGNVPAVIEAQGSDRILIRGFIVDMIQATTISCAPNPIPGSSEPLSVGSRSTLKHIYGTISGIREAIWKTLVADRAYHPFDNTVGSQKVLLEVPWTLPLVGTQMDLHTGVLENLTMWADQLGSFRASTADFDVFGHKLRSLFPESYASTLNWSMAKQALLQMSRTLELRRLMTTSGGRLGICPEAAVSGDFLAVFPGCSEPIVLRRTLEGESVSSGYHLVGSCYVDGIMEGQILHSGLFELEDIILI